MIISLTDWDKFDKWTLLQEIQKRKEDKDSLSPRKYNYTLIPMIHHTNNNEVLQTEIHLERWMKENCFNFETYSINGNAIHEGFGIDRIGGLFAWYYTERGEKNNLKYFQSEKEIIEFAYNEIKSEWANAHCVGFTTDKQEANELAGLLEGREIRFIQDEIPYYGPQRPV